jgi:hypothetical protein
MKFNILSHAGSHIGSIDAPNAELARQMWDTAVTGPDAQCAGYALAAYTQAQIQAHDRHVRTMLDQAMRAMTGLIAGERN